MKPRHLGLALVVLLLTGGVSWAGKEAYKLVMSQDKKLCQHMLAMFNADLKKDGALLYEQHREFVVWKPVDTGGDRTDKFCRQTLKQTFDINNDGTDELVIRRRHCFQSQLTDRLYIFPSNSNAAELLKDPNSRVLDTTPNHLEAMTYDFKKWPGTKSGDLVPDLYRTITLEPFQFGQTFYVSMTDLRQELVAIAKYLGGEDRDDVCYFQKVASK
ncbi:MAG: hypothetical protein NTAFB01_23050 [Nitrospira sp.]